MKKYFLLMALAGFVCRCGGNSVSFTPIKKPVAIALSSEDTKFENKTTRLAYVADQYTQSVIVLDTVQEKIVDTFEEDEFDYSPLPVGGEPSAIAVDSGVSPHRIFVADQFNKEIIAYEIDSSISQTNNFISYTPVALGSTNEGKSSRPLFKNSGGSSAPVITNLTVDSSVAKNEAWKLLYIGDGKYEVKGTVSGLQKKYAVEGKNYESDKGEIKFSVTAGGEKTTSDDQFFFSTAVVKPYQMSFSPVDLLINKRKLYILTKDDPSIVVYNLDTLTQDSATLIPDSASVPSHMFLHGKKIYISNLNSGDVFSFDIDTLAINTISTTLSSVKYVGANDDHLFLINNHESKLVVTNLLGSTVQKTLQLNDFGSFLIPYAVNGKSLGFIPNVSGNVDVVDMEKLARIDTDLGDKPDFINSQFFDVAPISSPELISVKGVEGKVQDETWQMVFENDSYVLVGSKSGVQVNKVFPGVAYTSDTGAISLRTRPSFSQPETDGDFFSFQTVDPIDPILVGNQSMAVGGIAFKRVSDGKSVAYVLEQTNGVISIINLNDYRLDKNL